jgi:hypothetical protein
LKKRSKKLLIVSASASPDGVHALVGAALATDFEILALQARSTWTNRNQNYQKFFGSFFQKRTCFLCFSAITANE